MFRKDKKDPTSITLEQAKKDYLSGKSEHRYAIVNEQSGLPWQLSKMVTDALNVGRNGLRGK